VAFSADRIILSPFTKEYRVEDASLRLLISIFCGHPVRVANPISSKKNKNNNKNKNA
jgi:hypothetical protein